MVSARRPLLAVLAFAVLVGCAHAPLKAPPLDASDADREAAWRELKPKKLVHVSLLQNEIVVDQWTRSMVLSGGVEIRDPIDLLPVVLPESDTARFAIKYRDGVQAGRRWQTPALLGLATLVSLTGFLIVAYLTGNLRPPAGEVLLAIDLVALSFMAFAFIVGRVVSGDPDADRLAAFHAYPADLRQFLFPAKAGTEPAAPHRE